ncbi:histidine triad nucleotide-binding protein [Roseivirga sp. 4D4]|uniref:histidine triad nucleotide-binding protein n=1 Tax=Roseivirga sp. 4D4 TaxID=1889784 RepID=UPI0009F43112|nr:histidine triad nucleotide-binding protein [Roseivirga sp. 4D4]
MKKIFVFAFLVIGFYANAQSKEYTTQKEKKLSVKSPFEKIWDGELPAEIVYKDNEIIAFVPLRRQTPVHYLIVPKKRIPTISDLKDEDLHLIGKMYKVARDLAKKYGIADTGYRLSMNTNEDAGQSVFHIHLHLLGGMKTGPMVDQTFIDPRSKKDDK